MIIFECYTKLWNFWTWNYKSFKNLPLNNIGSFALSKPGQFYSTLANFVIFRTIFWYNFVRKMLAVNDKVWAAKIECQGFHSNSCKHFKIDRKVVSKIVPTWNWRTLIWWLCIRLQRSWPRPLCDWRKSSLSQSSDEQFLRSGSSSAIS